MMVALLCGVVAFAALLGKQSEPSFKVLTKSEIVKAQKPMLNVKGLDRKAQPMRKVAQKAPEGAVLVTPPATADVVTYYTAGGKFLVGTQDGWADATTYKSTVNVVVDGSDMYIQGLAYFFEDAWIKGTINGATVTFANGQYIGSDDYGDEFIVGSNDGETVEDIVFSYDSAEGVLTATTTYILESGEADAVSPYCYWYVPVFSMSEPAAPELVEVPDNVEIAPFVMVYDEGNKAINVAVDGNDVYFQGFSSYVPEAWVKGTKDGNTVTFEAMQYVGTYSGYDSFAFYNGDAVFTYDAEAGTYSATGLVFGVLGDQYYDGKYTNPVLMPVVEQVATPADPEIDALENGDYGWYFTFNVPLIDNEGNPMVASKLSYIIYTDIEGEIAPLTFTPATHTYLTEDMTEIPFGFTENWDFYSNTIYLNELYSDKWNNIGIQSIYAGGGEVNATEIQWFHIKDYALTVGAEWIAAQQNYENAQDVTEIQISETVTGVLSQGENENNAPKYYTNGEALRLYATNTLTITSEQPMAKIVFTMTGSAKQMSLEADKGTYTFDANSSSGIWTGEETEVVFSVPNANSAQARIQKITIYFAKVEEPMEVVVLPEGVTAETWYFTGTSPYGKVKGAEVGVAIDGNDIYVQGLMELLPEAWVKGTIDGNTATFKSGQYFGQYVYEYTDGAGNPMSEAYDIFFLGYDGNNVADAVFEYDSEAGTLALDEDSYIVISMNERYEISNNAIYDYFYYVSITQDMPEFPEPLVAPEDLAVDTYQFKGYDTYYEEDDIRQVTAGFYGENEVWFCGLSYYVPEAWVKGTINEGVVTIPETYLGEYQGYFSNVELFFSGATFTYDAEAGTFTSPNGFVSYETPQDSYWMDEYIDVVLTKINDIAVAPANPTITNFVAFDTYYPKVEFNIPLEDVNGAPILTSKLAYQFFIDKGEGAEPLVLTPDIYVELEEDMSEIPYEFSDAWDIYNTKLYLNQSEDELKSWKKIGLQTIYYGGGECNKSEIDWYDVEEYWNLVTGIAGVNADSKSVVYFDLQGRRVAAPGKGLYIANGKKVVLK